MTDWDKMVQEFRNSAIKDKVRLPRKGTQNGEVLLYYWQNKNKILLKENIERVVCDRLGIPTKDIQAVRHLGKQNGFDILQQGSIHNGQKLRRGSYVFKGFGSVNSYWGLTRRDESDLDWANLKEKFNHCCATCGSKEGRPHKKTKEITVLQKGHMNPLLEMTNDNIIPQCSYCNQVYKDKFVFDSVGNVKEPTVAAILSLPEDQKIEIMNVLFEQFA